MDVDLSSFCEDQIREQEQESLDLQKRETCEVIKELEGRSIDPISMTKKDEEGNEWRLRFHFGFTRTNYHKTDLNIKSDVITTVIKDVEMYERTSADHYDPRTWEHFQDMGRWIDEPTNTFTFSLEKNKNVFYLTVFHPKYLKSLLYKKTTANNQQEYTFSETQETYDFSAPIPENSQMLYLGNTHMNMNWQIGYGRQFVIFNSKKSGKLSYTLKGDIGISTGKARSVHIIPGVAWDDYQDDHKVQGINTSFGQRLEYQKGRVSLFVDNKYILAKIQHGFYDGTIDYNLKSTATTFGVGIDLFTKKRK